MRVIIALALCICMSSSARASMILYQNWLVNCSGVVSPANCSITQNKNDGNPAHWVQADVVFQGSYPLLKIRVASGQTGWDALFSVDMLPSVNGKLDCVEEACATFLDARGLVSLYQKEGKEQDPAVLYVGYPPRGEAYLVWVELRIPGLQDAIRSVIGTE